MGSLIMRSRTMLFLCSTVLALAPAAAQERMYKCVDARGKVYYTQVPPPECLGRDTQELNKSRTRELARSRKRRAQSRIPRGSSPERRSAVRSLKRKKSST